MRFFYDLPVGRKLFIIVTVPAVAAFLLAGALLFALDVSLLRRTVKEEAAITASLTANQIADPLRLRQQGQAEQTLQMLSQSPRIFAASLYDKNGDLFARYFRDRQLIELPKKPPGSADNYFQGLTHYTFQPIKIFNRNTQQMELLGTLYLQTDAGFLMEHFANYLLIVLLVIALGIALTLVLSSRLKDIIGNPIIDLALTSRLVSDQKDYSIRAIKHHDDEIGNLVDEFNEMLTQIEERDRALQDGHDALEGRVNQRTKELRQENEEHRRTAITLEQEIKERKKIETGLNEAVKTVESANRSKGDFLANMSHEIRTPMNGIIGMTELLLKSTLSSVQYKYAQTVRRSGRSLLKIIDDILDFSKIEAGQLSIDPIPFDLKIACEDVVELLTTRAEEKGLALILRYSADAPKRVIADAGRIRQIITNLVANALKFTHEGYVLIRIDTIQKNPDDVTLYVSVEDTGIGAPKEKLDIIFGKYEQADAAVTRRYGGTGLGLAISKELVELMGGEIGVRSREGIGSVFHFTLTFPLDSDGIVPKKVITDIEGVRILIVEHSSINQKVLLEQVGAWGMKAEVAPTAADAIAILHKAEAEGNPFAIALIDDQMPGARGDVIGREIKSDELIGDTLLVLLTALGERGDAQRILEFGFSAYLTRPIRQNVLVAALATILAAKQRGEELELVTRHSIAEADGREPSSDNLQKMHLGLRVLVAEDNFVNQQVAYEILKDLGCSITIVDNGEDAVENVKVGVFDVILMDCQMPIMDGYTATEEIRKFQGDKIHTSIIAMTARAMKGDREKCIDAGMDDYISKPIDPESVYRVIQGCKDQDQHSARSDDSDFSHTSDLSMVLDMAQAYHVTGGKIDMFKRLATIFLYHMPVRIQELKNVIDARDLSETSRLSHSIKGAAASIGGDRMRDVASDIEILTRDNSLKGVEALFEHLSAEFETLKSALDGLNWELEADRFSSTATESSSQP